MTMTFEQLQNTFASENLVEVTDRESALKDIASKTSCCWGAGGRITEGWTQLASPSPQSKGDKRTVFVCKSSLIE